MAANWSGRRVSNSRHSAWKADALPTELLPHLVQGEGFEPSKACAGRFTVCSHWPLGHPCIYLELAMGLEPATFCLQSSCSTIELRQLFTHHHLRLEPYCLKSIMSIGIAKEFFTTMLAIRN